MTGGGNFEFLNNTQHTIASTSTTESASETAASNE